MRTARRHLLTLMIAAPIFVVLGPSIRAQSPQSAPEAAPSVNLTAEQRHVIKELLKELKVQPVTGPAPTAIDETVPENVAIQPIPVEVGQRVPQIRSHAFYIKDQRIVLVSTKDRKIADVIE